MTIRTSYWLWSKRTRCIHDLTLVLKMILQNEYDKKISLDYKDIRKHGLSHNASLNKKKIEKIFDYLFAGKSHRQISKELNLTKKTVDKYKKIYKEITSRTHVKGDN